MADEELIRQLQKSIEQLTEEVKSLKEQLAEKQDKLNIPNYVPSPFELVDNIPLACASCPNHPRNGGSGICHCTLGMTKVTC